MKELASKQIPINGDWFIHGLEKHTVLGFNPLSKCLMFAKTYADRDDPLEVPISSIKPLDLKWSPTWWIAKERVSSGKRVLFNVSFTLDDKNVILQTYAVSMRKARQNIIHRIGVDYCGISKDNRGAPERAAKVALADSAGKPYNENMLKIEPALKN